MHKQGPGAAASGRPGAGRRTIPERDHGGSTHNGLGLEVLLKLLEMVLVPSALHTWSQVLHHLAQELAHGDVAQHAGEDEPLELASHESLQTSMWS